MKKKTTKSKSPLKKKKLANPPAISEKRDLFSSKEYVSTLATLKKKIQESQLKAISAANKELISLYWTIGKTVVEKQEESGWGSKFIEKLAKDLQNAFPGIDGFSRTNVFRMRAFYLEYKIVPPAVGQINELEHLGILAQIPWSHNIVLMEKLDKIEERMWYAHKTLENGWSRNILALWIDSRLHKREGKAVTNFKDTLPSPQSDLAQQSLKDPYLFDFLTLHKDHLEKDLERGLVDHIQQFLLELGQGFAFLGKQYPIVVEGDTYTMDLLFYHVKLRCFVVIELKARAFKPEDTGQLNFYLSAVDDMLKHPADNPTIGILLCKTRNKVVAEYAFRDIKKPMGVVEYETMLTRALPKELKSSLPTVKEIEEALERDIQQKEKPQKKKTRKK
jgi:predicted nuclease of restriction endonuclease-like (RecB) superfamily